MCIRDSHIIRHNTVVEHIEPVRFFKRRSDGGPFWDHKGLPVPDKLHIDISGLDISLLRGDMNIIEWVSCHLYALSLIHIFLFLLFKTFLYQAFCLSFFLAQMSRVKTTLKDDMTSSL